MDADGTWRGKTAEEWWRELDRMFGVTPKVPPLLDDRTLDAVFASRTHVRVLRVLVELDRKLNLSVRGIARRAGASHGRVQHALEDLLRLRLVTVHRAPGYALYQLDDGHPLLGAIRELFEMERGTAETAASATD